MSKYLWRFWCFVLLFGVLFGSVHASTITPPGGRASTVWVDTPDEQPGLPKNGFSFDISIFHEEGSVKGQISFEVTSSSNGDMGGMKISSLPIDSSGKKIVLKAVPEFFKEGWYTVKVKTKTEDFEHEENMNFLYLDGLVFYDWGSASLISSIANYNMRSNLAYIELKEKARQKKEIAGFLKSSGNYKRGDASEFLEKPEAELLGKLLYAERKRVFEDIRAKVWGRNSGKAGSSDPAKDEHVTVKVRWPVDANHSVFLPLHGAKIEIININNVGAANDGVFASGILDANGEFTFASPVDNLKYRVRVSGSHKDFDIYVSDQSGQMYPLILEWEQVNIIDIKVDQSANIFAGDVNSWSVFQAMHDLATNSSSFLGLSSTPVFKYVITNHLEFDPITSAQDIDFAYYSSADKVMVLGAGNFFDWDVIGHEYAHAVAHENNAILAMGGNHSGENQYDYHGDANNPTDPANPYNNPATYQNKQASNRLALNEAYATWFGVGFWRNSAYRSLISGVGDTQFTDVMLGGNRPPLQYDLEGNVASYGRNRIYGEDSEIGVGRLLWDLTDSDNEANVRAVCSRYCKDEITVSEPDFMSRVISGKNLDGISDFYKSFYDFFVGSGHQALSQVGDVDAAAVTKMLQLGAVFAEFGVAANIGQANNADPFADIDDRSVRDLNMNPIQLVWEQHKTGSMPGLDNFEILFYSEGLDKLVYKIDGVNLSPANPSPSQPNTYTYHMPKDKAHELVQAVSKLPYKLEHKLAIVIKGSASGNGAANGVVSTGPYYGNAEEFPIKLSKRLAVIAVDSSGSNAWTDPQNLRIGAAQKMLQSMGQRNAEIAAGKGPRAGELPTMVAALDFDDRVRELSDFAPAQDLAARNIFSAIDSRGGTDIAAAIHYATRKINPSGAQGGAAKPFPNTAKTYVLTDMDNNAGLAPVVSAIRQSGAAGIPVNVGHLVPLLTKNAQFAPEDLRGEPAVGLKVAEPMDPIAEALLASGGSYAIIENAEAQDAWVALMNELNNTDPATRTEVNLPLDVKLYGMAVADDGRTEPTYVFTATQTGPATVTVDGKGNFVPAVSVNGAGTQTALGQDLYEVRFNAQAGTAYRILVNEAASAAGLYSIVVRQQQNAAPQETVPVPVGGAVAIVLMGMLLMLGAGWAQQHSRRRRA